MVLAMVAGMLFLGSCSKTYKDIEVKDVKVGKVSLLSIRSVDADLIVVIDNPAVQKFTARNIKGNVYQKGKQIATFSSNDELVLESKKVSENRLKVRVALDSPLGLLGSLADKGLDLDDYTLDFAADVSSGVMRFPYRKKGIKVGSLMKEEPFQKLQKDF